MKDKECDAYALIQKIHTSRRFDDSKPTERGDTKSHNYPFCTDHHLVRLFRNRPDIRYGYEWVHCGIDPYDQNIRVKKTTTAIYDYTEENIGRPSRQKHIYYQQILEEQIKVTPHPGWHLYLQAFRGRERLGLHDEKMEIYGAKAKSAWLEEHPEIGLMERPPLEWAAIDDPFKMPAIDQLPVRRYGGAKCGAARDRNLHTPVIGL